MEQEQLRYFRLNEYWRFSEWLAKDSARAAVLYDSVFYEADLKTIAEAFKLMFENEFFYFIPILMLKMNETFCGQDVITNILFKELSPYFKEPSKFEDICRKIIKGMEENINSEKINGIL